ncbi:MAG: hypothetical protein ACFHWZ_03565 [Phycisphaerales bacterium]
MKTTKRHHPARGPRGHRDPSSRAAGDPPAAPKSPKRRPWNAGVRTGLLAVAIVGTAVIATVGTIGSWPSLVAASEPTAMDKLTDLQHLGIGADGLLAAGLSVSQASAVLNWVGTDRQRFDAIRVASSQVRSATADLETIRAEMVRTGRTEALDASLAQVESQLAAAKTAYDGLISSARAAVQTLVVNDLEASAAWPLMSNIMDSSGYKVPIGFRVLDLSDEEWEQVEHYHAVIDSRPEAIELATVALVENFAISSEVVNAQTRADSNISLLIQSLLAD